jgi:hypothetical protein
MVGVGAAFYELFNMATKTVEHDLMYFQATSLIKRDPRIQNHLGIPISTSSMTKRSFANGEQIHFVVSGVYAARGVAYASKIDGKMRLDKVEVWINGRSVVVFNNERKSWFRWGSPLAG